MQSQQPTRQHMKRRIQKNTRPSHNNGSHNNGGGHSNGSHNNGNHNGSSRNSNRFRTDESGQNDAVVTVGSKPYQRAVQMREKYLDMAKDAHVSGDRVAAESCYQHADHFSRVINAANDLAKEQRPARSQHESRSSEPRNQESRTPQHEQRASEDTAHNESASSTTSTDTGTTPSKPSSSRRRHFDAPRSRDAQAAAQNASSLADSQTSLPSFMSAPLSVNTSTTSEDSNRLPEERDDQTGAA